VAIAMTRTGRFTLRPSLSSHPHTVLACSESCCTPEQALPGDQPWRVFQRGLRGLMTNVRPRRRTRIDPSFFFNDFNEFLTFMAFSPFSDTDENGSR
jgi:hypothetical protein